MQFIKQFIAGFALLVMSVTVHSQWENNPANDLPWDDDTNPHPALILPAVGTATTTPIVLPAYTGATSYSALLDINRSGHSSSIASSGIFRYLNGGQNIDNGLQVDFATGTRTISGTPSQSYHAEFEWTARVSGGDSSTLTFVFCTQPQCPVQQIQIAELQSQINDLQQMQIAELQSQIDDLQQQIDNLNGNQRVVVRPPAQPAPTDNSGSDGGSSSGGGGGGGGGSGGGALLGIAIVGGIIYAIAKPNVEFAILPTGKNSYVTQLSWAATDSLNLSARINESDLFDKAKTETDLKAELKIEYRF